MNGHTTTPAENKVRIEGQTLAVNRMIDEKLEEIMAVIKRMGK